MLSISRVNNALTQINFNATNFINARFTQRVFSVWPVARPVVGEMDMHSVANLATFQIPLAISLQKSAQNLFSFWELQVLPCEREVLLSQRAHTSLSLSLCASDLFSSLFIPLSDNRNSKIYQWKEFYWEFSCIKIQYVGTERQTNAIINNIGYVHFACSEEVSWPVCKNVNRFV